VIASAKAPRPAVVSPIAPAAKPAPAPAAPPESRPAPPAPEPKPVRSAPKDVLYDVVLGTYQSEAGARSEITALEILGFSVKDATISALEGGGYRLSIARFGSRRSAESLASSLSKMSFQPHVEVVQR